MVHRANRTEPFDLELLQPLDYNPEFSSQVRFYFSPEARRTIGARDRWTCQCGCGRRFQDGWLVDIAHYPEDHQREVDNDVTHGRVLSLGCHFLEHLDMLGDKPTMRNIRAVGLASQRIFAKGLHTDLFYERNPMQLIEDRQWLFEQFEQREINPREFVLNLENPTEII